MKTLTYKYDNIQNLSLLVLRITAAAIFIYAGVAKWPFWANPTEGTPEIMINLIRFLSIVEPLGAIALLLGFLTRWAAAGLTIIMLGAIVILIATLNSTFFTQPQILGWDYNLLIFGQCLGLVAFGAGNWSLDNYLKEKRQRSF